MKSTKQYTAANRKAWNEATPVHQQQRKIDLKTVFQQKGYNVLDGLITKKLEQLPIAGKKVAHLCCNNGMETLSIVNIGAESAVGIDISDAAITEATELVRVSGINARFVQSDLYEIGNEFDLQFDVVYFSIGALCWLPELNAIFQTVSRMLMPGGQLVIYDMHPFLNVFPVSGEEGFDQPTTVRFSYFKEEPWEDTDGLDYIGGTTYESSPCYSFAHPLSRIMTAILNSGIQITTFEEYRHDISMIFTHLEKTEHPLPMSYLLTGTKQR